jgi:hypothetical protein
MLSSDGAVGGADEVAEDGYIGSICTDAAGIHREAEFFGLFEIHAGIVKFRQTETLRGQDAVEARRIYRTGRTMTAPWTSSYLVELLPIAFVPRSHCLLLAKISPYLQLNCLSGYLSPDSPFLATASSYSGVHSVIRPAHRFGCTRFQKGSPLQKPKPWPLTVTAKASFASAEATTAGGDDTIYFRRQDIFLACCFKHATGSFVAGPVVAFILYSASCKDKAFPPYLPTSLPAPACCRQARYDNQSSQGELC